ncbi:MAG: diacylglycerol kinase family protein [Daejeonella sp.]
MNKFFKGFYYAWKGLNYTFRTQINFRVQLMAALLVLLLSCYLGLNTDEWLWIISAVAIVLMAELANTAIETLVDMISPEFNPKAGIVKDISAAVALISSILALITGILILLPKLIDAS